MADLSGNMQQFYANGLNPNPTFEGLAFYGNTLLIDCDNWPSNNATVGPVILTLNVQNTPVFQVSQVGVTAPVLLTNDTGWSMLTVGGGANTNGDGLASRALLHMSSLSAIKRSIHT